MLPAGYLGMGCTPSVPTLPKFSFCPPVWACLMADHGCVEQAESLGRRWHRCSKDSSDASVVEPATELPSCSCRWSLQVEAERGHVGNKLQPLDSSHANWDRSAA